MSDTPVRELYETISLEDGKYIFKCNVDTHNLECLRFGKEWRSFIGDKATLSLFNYAHDNIRALKEENARLKEEVSRQRERAMEWEDCYKLLCKSSFR